MKKIFTKSILFFIGFVFTCSVQASHLSDQLLLSAQMDGSQEVPAVIINAVGVTTLSLNATRDTICLRMTVTGLSGSITGAHVHEGAVGVNGPVLFDITPFFNGTTAIATITGSDLTPALLSAYLQGMHYVNVHTAANPNGEIRGQIYPETDMQFTANLDGAQEVPPVVTDAIGIGAFTLSQHMEKMMIRVVVDSLSGPIVGAHLHRGAIGVSGPVAIDLTSNVSGNTITATIDPDTILADLMAGNIYINVHTALNPNGEIRGQLVMDTWLAFDAWMDGTQEVPPVVTTATGLVNLKLNTTFDTLTYDVVFTGLTGGSATAAHIHLGEVGISGPPIHDMSADINGNRITGMATGATLTQAFLSDLLKGNLYINVHNATYPAGEIRGQIYRVLREGYTAAIDGSQEVPPVTTSALATAAVSIDRNETDVHFIVVADGLTATGIHFHQGGEGQNGPIIFDMTPLFINNGAFGYWKSTDSAAFTLVHALLFRTDSVYINLHTVANPNGEIRGQVERGFFCSDFPTASNENTLDAVVTVYPNPAIQDLHLDTRGNIKDASITIYSVVGNKVLSADINPAVSSHVIDISSLAKGMYLIELRADNKRFSQSFIKE
jgi:hypothetical protein